MDKTSNNEEANYTNTQTFHKKDGTEYKVIARSDNNCCTEIRFNY